MVNKPSIVSVIGEHVDLRKPGKEYVGRCPFHVDKTPSFSVSEEKGLFYCFSCGESGDVFDFIVKLEGIGFREAKARLGRNRRIQAETIDNRGATGSLIAGGGMDGGATAQNQCLVGRSS
jgi:DNA primase